MNKFQRILFLFLQSLVGMGIVILPLYIDPHALQGFREPKMILFTFLGSLCFIIVALTRMFDRFHANEVFPKKILGICLLILAGLFIYHCYRDANLDLSGSTTSSGIPLKTAYRIHILLPVIAAMGWIYGSLLAFASRGSKRKLTLLISAGLFLECLIVSLEIIDLKTGLPLNPIKWVAAINLQGQVVKSELYGTIGNPNFLAGYLAIGFFPLLGLILTSRSLWNRTILSGLGIVLLVVILLTRSKGGMLALMVGTLHLFVISLFYRKNSKTTLGGFRVNPRMIGLVLLISVFLVGFIIVQSLSADSFGNSLVETFRLRGDSITVRAILATCAIEIWKKSPWLGAGIGEFKVDFIQSLRDILESPKGNLFLPFVERLHSLRANHVHNEYLQFLVEWGILGFSVIILLLVLYQSEAINRLTQKNRSDFLLNGCLLSGVWAGLGGCLFDLPLHRPAQVTLLVVLVGATLSTEQSSFSPNQKGILAKGITYLLSFLMIMMGSWLQYQSTLRYVGIREGFMARAVLEGMIPGADYKRAGTSLRWAMTKIPGEAEYAFLMAYYRLKYEKDLNGAITLSRQTRQISDHPGILLIEARAQLEKKNWESAEAILSTLTQLKRRDPGLNYLRGRIQQARGNLQDAKKFYQLEIDNARENRIVNMDIIDSYIRLGSLQEQTGQFMEALKTYTSFWNSGYAGNIGYPQVELRLGDLYLDRIGDPEMAVKFYNEALKKLKSGGNTQEAADLQRKLEQVKQNRKEVSGG